jgi:hypothetical protein
MVKMDPMQRQKFDQLEQALEMFIENTRHLCVMAGDFQAPGLFFFAFSAFLIKNFDKV